MPENEKLEPGWYWVRVGDAWRIALQAGGVYCTIGGNYCVSDLSKVGPRIDPPKEEGT